MDNEKNLYKLPSLNLIKKIMNFDYKCTNCGNIGHLYKTCIEPIISYGIICYNKKINKFLLMQRRHSIAYIDFIRGKYSFEDMNFLYMLLENMNSTEKNNLLTKNFDTLWNNLWINNKNKIENSYRNNEFKKSKNMFQMLCDGIYYENKEYVLSNILHEINNNKEIEWGFPKGRRDHNESDLQCAIREFNEETNMPIYQFNEKNKIESERYIEEFMGSNGIAYKYIYYIYFINTDTYEEPFIDINNLDQVSEVGDIKWFTYDEAIEKLTCNRKKSILRKIKINYL